MQPCWKTLMYQLSIFTLLHRCNPYNQALAVVLCKKLCWVRDIDLKTKLLIQQNSLKQTRYKANKCFYAKRLLFSKITLHKADISMKQTA